MKFKNNTLYLTCQDHLVSSEQFTLMHNPDYDLLLTQPQPAANKIGRYYQSASYISHTDAKKNLMDRVYQMVKKKMLSKKIKLIEKEHPEKGSLLDIGAGTGDFLKTAEQNKWTVKGVEPNAKARKIAQEKGLSILSDSSALKEELFDVISMWHVLEHVPDLEKQIETLDKHLKKNGTLYIAVPNYKSYDARNYGKFWAAYDVPRHLWHFSQTSIKKIFLEKGFCLEALLPLKYDAYYVSLLSESHKGKSNPIRAFFTGFISNWKARQTKEYSSLIYVLKRSE